MFPIKYIDNNLVWNKDNEVFAYYEPVSYTHLDVYKRQGLHKKDKLCQNNKERRTNSWK